MSQALAAESSELFRAVNERILELGPPAIGDTDFICECADVTCARVMRMTLREYEAMRSEPELHAVVPGHEQRALDEVVGRTGRYILVRKRPAA